MGFIDRRVGEIMLLCTVFLNGSGFFELIFCRLYPGKLCDSNTYTFIYFGVGLG